ncbi:MAG: hypothetical protein ACK4ZJ_03925 [Allorhizobium sp.]
MPPVLQDRVLCTSCMDLLCRDCKLPTWCASVQVRSEEALRSMPQSSKRAGRESVQKQALLRDLPKSTKNADAILAFDASLEHDPAMAFPTEQQLRNQGDDMRCEAAVVARVRDALAAACDDTGSIPVAGCDFLLRLSPPVHVHLM